MNQFDIAFFESIFFKYYDRIYSGFIRKTGSDATAQDLTQLTFVKFWETRAYYTFDLPVELQLNRKAKLVFIDWLRKEAHQRKLATELKTFAIGHVRINKFEITNTLHVAIDQLPPACKKIFILAYLEGLSHKEIASSLGISVKTVDAHIFKALQRLRKILALCVVLAVITG